MRCFILLGGEDDEKVTQFTDKSWRKVCECAKAWCDATDSETINKCRLLADQIMKLLPMTDPVILLRMPAVTGSAMRRFVTRII